MALRKYHWMMSFIGAVSPGCGSFGQTPLGSLPWVLWVSFDVSLSAVFQATVVWPLNALLGFCGGTGAPGFPVGAAALEPFIHERKLDNISSPFVERLPA